MAPHHAPLEDAAGYWRMVAQYDRTYGTVRMVKRGGEIGYRAEAIRQPDAEVVLVGYYRTHRAAASAIHAAELQGTATAGPPNHPRRG